LPALVVPRLRQRTSSPASLAIENIAARAGITWASGSDGLYPITMDGGHISEIANRPRSVCMNDFSNTSGADHLPNKSLKLTACGGPLSQCSQLKNMTLISTEYEKLVRELHEALLQADGIDTVDVRQNVKLLGKSGATHQIDVYWEFRLAGVMYKTCIECKYYGTKIKKSHMAAFAAILEDIGNATGIFATTVGFQEGAILFAKSKGIRPLLVNHLIKTVAITSNFVVPSTEIVGISYNKAQAKASLEKLGLESFELTTHWSHSTVFYDASGHPMTTLKELFAGKYEIEGDFNLEKPGLYDSTEIGLLEIDEIKYKIKIFTDQHTMGIPLNETEKAIVEDILGNTSCYLRDDGSVTKFQEQGFG
jgi:Restriction endonuclease